MIQYGILNLEFIKFTNKHCFFTKIILANYRKTEIYTCKIKNIKTSWMYLTETLSMTSLGLPMVPLVPTFPPMVALVLVPLAPMVPLAAENPPEFSGYQRYQWLPIVPLVNFPMVSLVNFPVLPLGVPQTKPLSVELWWTKLQTKELRSHST